MSDNKTKRIIAYLQEHGSITPMDALQKFHVFRLASIIYNLREHYLYPIETVMEEGKDAEGNTVTYARYFLRGMTNG